MLAPSFDETSDLLISLLAAHQSVTNAALGLRNMQLTPPENPASWYKGLADGLDAVKANAETWLSDVAPKVIAGLPQTVTAYSSRFKVASTALGTAEQSQAIDQFNWLKDSLSDVPQQAAALDSLITDFGERFKSQRSMLDGAIAAANKEESDSRTTRDALAQKISDLSQDISAATVKAKGGMTSIATSGGSLAAGLLTYSFGLAAATGPAAPIVGTFVAIAGLTYGAIINGLKDAEIAKKLGEVRDFQVQLKETDQRIAALASIQTTLDDAEHAILDVQSTARLAPVWDEIASGLDSVVSRLGKPGVTLASLEEMDTLSQSATTWQKLATVATNIRNAATFDRPPHIIQLADIT